MDPINKASGGSKKGLYIVIGVVVVLLLGGYMMRGNYYGMMGSRVNLNGVNVDRNVYSGSTTYSDGQGTVTIGSNKLPDNWPSDAPAYPNAVIQYSGSSNPQTGAEGSAVVFMTSDSVANVVDFYKRELAGKGWKVEQTATMGTSTALSATKDSRTFGVFIADAGNGQVGVTIGIEGAQ